MEKCHLLSIFHNDLRSRCITHREIGTVIVVAHIRLATLNIGGHHFPRLLTVIHDHSNVTMGGQILSVLKSVKDNSNAHKFFIYSM